MMPYTGTCRREKGRFGDHASCRRGSTCCFGRHARYGWGKGGSSRSRALFWRGISESFIEESTHEWEKKSSLEAAPHEGGARAGASGKGPCVKDGKGASTMPYMGGKRESYSGAPPHMGRKGRNLLQPPYLDEKMGALASASYSGWRIRKCQYPRPLGAVKEIEEGLGARV